MRVDIETVGEWSRGLQALGERIGGRFARAEPRRRALAYVKGLMSDLPRKNGWQLAEQAGELTPDGMQRLLNGAQWDEAGVRDDIREYIREELGTAAGILVVDETGFLKKGDHSVGVKRQYSGTAGRIENCQIGVFLSYTSDRGHTLIDRELYLPKEWAADPIRRQEAGVPEGVAFRTKPQLAQEMLVRALENGLPCAWVSGDSIYGGDRRLRLWLEERSQWFVLGVSKQEPLWRGVEQKRADEWLAHLNPEDWSPLSCGEGAKGPRIYEWALLPLPRWGQPDDVLHALLVRRSLEDGELAYFVVFAPVHTSLQTLVTVAGQRWTIEECFEAAKNEVGLDEYEVRQWTAWYRHITLSMLALAYLTITRRRAVEEQAAKKRTLKTGGNVTPHRAGGASLAGSPDVGGSAPRPAGS